MHQHSCDATRARARASARWLHSARITGSTASPLENCPPYFYHITSFLSHLPLLGLIAIIVQPPPSLVFPASLRFSAILSLFLSLSPYLVPVVRSRSAFDSPSISSLAFLFFRFVILSRLLGRPASGSPQRRDLRHFTCVSFANVLLCHYRFVSPPFSLLVDSFPLLGRYSLLFSTKIARLHSSYFRSQSYRLSLDNDCYRFMP